jgi:uncharacterized damage-inducible protein DinB
MNRLRAGIEQLVFARTYTERLLEAVPAADWFRMPAEGVTHVAWQVGHIAFAEYRLVLDRFRGPRLDDANLISDEFLRHFGRESVPEPDPARNPNVDEIRAVLASVHRQTLAELAEFPDAGLDEPPLKPHSLCKTKGECLRWCSHHEMLHAGQIALIRRLLGAKPLW